MGDINNLIGRVQQRLRDGAFQSEAAVSFGIVVPILQALGWDPAEPDQVIPEFSTGRGRVDFALCAGARRPSIFIEVKKVGLATDGDRQLFEYAFHEGVPVCVLTDGREWSFFLPSGQGTYQDRKFYRLRLDERDGVEIEKALTRYLARDRVKSGEARDAADRDYRDQAARREASRSLPTAWERLVSAPEELLVDLVSEQVEALCGYPPPQDEVLSFLRSLQIPEQGRRATSDRKALASPIFSSTPAPERSTATNRSRNNATKKLLQAKAYGRELEVKSAIDAMAQLLSLIVKTDPDRISQLATAARGKKRNHIARTVEEIYPERPDLAAALEFYPGWLVGTNIANREKDRIIRRACEVYGLSFGSDIVLELPNA